MQRNAPSLSGKGLGVRSVAPHSWDAVIVGGRVAGAVTAIKLARRGHLVLVVDRARFPSDTLSTHSFGFETAVRFGHLRILEQIEASGAPPLRRFRMADLDTKDYGRPARRRPSITTCATPRPNRPTGVRSPR